MTVWPRLAMGSMLVLALLVCGHLGRARATNVGPSFPCLPMPQDALGRLTCLDQALARADIRLVQTYYALRQFVGPGAQDTLRTEILTFTVNARRACGLPPVEPRRDQSRDPLPPGAANCVIGAYEAQRATWAHLLSGAAAEEAARPPERNIALQQRLQMLGFLPADSAIDGVFGTGTRSAVIGWHRASGRPDTDFLSDADADILLQGRDTPSEQASGPAKPLAAVSFSGAPVSLVYQNVRLSIAIETSNASEPCSAAILSDEVAKPAPPCRAVVARIAINGQPAAMATLVVLADDTDLDRLMLNAEVHRLDGATALPQIVFRTYTGGAHCCTLAAVGTTGADGDWQFVSLGEFDGDVGFELMDPAREGIRVMVGKSPGFDYTFASYAGSFSPVQIRKLSGNTVQDVTRDPRYRPLMVDRLRQMETEVPQGQLSEPNGYFAGWVAQKALVGQLNDAWRVMLARYDRESTLGLDVCAVDESVWPRGSDGGVGTCPQGQELTLPYPEALARHLQSLGFISRAQVVALGFDPARVDQLRAASTAWYKQRMDRGWFVIATGERCTLATTPESPAALITADRAHGVEDTVSVMDSDADGKPAIVRVEQPRARGLVSTVTFYRGAARCQASQGGRRMQLQDLR